ncbi:hypothetical protein [Haloferax elongans]|uniref:hypothetical protein n=1 Tax=Haloferax elongans TaxID=403191 RepID=UPI00135F133D|nr:hypothetical protein [Haloferax elongans]
MADKIEVHVSYGAGFENIVVDEIKESASGILLRNEVEQTVGFVTYENLAYAKPVEE